jgi:probable HAF family extracellular repeat protein
MRPLHLLRVLIVVAGGVATCPPASGQLPCRYEIEATILAPACPFPYLDPPLTVGVAINSRGDVCGWHQQCVVPIDEEAFVSLAPEIPGGQRTWITIPRPPGVTSAMASDINDHRIVCGSWWRSNSPLKVDLRGFVFDVNAMQLIAELMPAPGGDWCSASAINNAGTVCGTRSIGPGLNPQTAFTWRQDQGYIDLGLINGYDTFASDINSAGMVTGTFAENMTSTPFIWGADSFVSLGTLAGLETVPSTLTDDGWVVGRSVLPMKGYPFLTNHAFLWNGTTMQDLGTLPGHHASGAGDIGPGGIVVGGSSGSGKRRAVVWSGGVVRDLNLLIPASTGAWLDGAGSINARGLILARGIDAGGDYVTFILAPIGPSPGDLDENCSTNVTDLLQLLSEWGETDSIADLNEDGFVNHADLIILLKDWSKL